MKIDVNEMRARVAWLEELLQPLDGLSPGKDWREWNRRVAVLWARVERRPGVSLKYTGGTCQFSMCGITTSAAAGFSAAARSWLRKANAILAEEAA